MKTKSLSATLLLVGVVATTTALAHPSLQVFITAKVGIPNNNYFLDVDNCFAAPFTHNCDGAHNHHYDEITGTNNIFSIPRNEHTPAGKVMFSVIGIRHPYSAAKPVICVTKYSTSDSKAFVPTRVTKIHLTVYKTNLGFGPERCEIFY